MSKRCPNSKYVGTARLADYQLVFRLHADIELCSDCEVEGVLWEMDQDDLYTLDKFESVPNYYIRHMVWVYPDLNSCIPEEHIHTNGAVKAWVYEMVDKDKYNFPPQSYWECCNDGYDAHNLSYNQLDSAIKMIIDLESSYDSK